MKQDGNFLELLIRKFPNYSMSRTFPMPAGTRKRLHFKIIITFDCRSTSSTNKAISAGREREREQGEHRFPAYELTPYDYRPFAEFDPRSSLFCYKTHAVCHGISIII